jgi:hypothetical protein
MPATCAHSGALHVQERSDLERTRTSNQARLDQNEAVCREMRENVRSVACVISVCRRGC